VIEYGIPISDILIKQPLVHFIAVDVPVPFCRAPSHTDFLAAFDHVSVVVKAESDFVIR
jgi:hypothetical protein